MTRDKDLNARIAATVARVDHANACAEVMRAKLRADTQAISKAEAKARDALHKILAQPKV